MPPLPSLKIVSHVFPPFISFGSKGAVYLARERKTKYIVAIKVYNQTIKSLAFSCLWCVHINEFNSHLIQF